jgi:multimeric flavodoxin WrbA
MRSKEIGQREGLLAYPRDGALRHRFESTIKKCLVASGHDPEYPITIGDAGTSTMSKISVLGLSGSLRNARFHRGSRSLTHEIRRVATETDLIAYLATQTKIRADDFLEAGLSSGAPFDEVYQALHRKRFERGLSNSEAATAAALWAAHRAGAEISHIGLAEHFPPNGPVREPKHLAAALRAADGIIVSSPVYFGDRGSLVQSLFGFIASDASLEQDMAGKIYGGLAVGAKRNGGQETTLIYQMLDMLDMGLLAVGNGHETTAQYGGTAQAGDIGTFASDRYGLETCIGTGLRVARIARMKSLNQSGATLTDRLSIHLWLVQDSEDGRGHRFYSNWAKELCDRNPSVSVRIFDATKNEVVRCLACEVCPTHLGNAREYRCIVTSADDFFVKHHQELLEADAILIGAYCPENHATVKSVYQQFVERTRYLRRDNYVFEDLLVAPFVLSHIEARQNLHIRMAGSMIRHHTVLHRPIIALEDDGQLLNAATIARDSDLFLARSRELLVGRYLQGKEETEYRPVGYEISAAKTREEQASGRMTKAIGLRRADHHATAHRRLSLKKSGSK